MRSAIICLLFCLVMALGSTDAQASGEWLWVIDTNPSTGTLYFTGTAGAGSPITLTGRIFNNDSASSMSFDGITLKTDELIADDPQLLESLWSTDPSAAMPGSYTVPSMNNLAFTVGRFDLASAIPGTYKFKLTAAASYDTVAAQPAEITSDFVTVVVNAVPEPSSLVGLGSVLGCCFLLKRKARHS